MKTARKKSNRRSKTVDGSEKKQDTGLSPSKRHREKLNNVMDELSELLPLPSDAKSGLDRLSILKLTVSFFQTQNLAKSAGNPKQLHVGNKKKVHLQGVSLSEMALEAVGGFFIVLTEDGNVYYVSENVMKYLGYSQTRLMHQEFFSHVHPDDLQGLKSCFDECPLKKKSFPKEDNDLPFTVPDSRKECYCNIRCHAGRLSSHISPFYYKTFRLYGHLKLIQTSKKAAGSQYGFFALCSPVSRSENVVRPIKEHVERYTCKMDVAMANLQVDSKGLKTLRFNEQDLMGRSAYFFFHPDDLSSMAVVHERLIKDSKASITFRVLKGNGKWQWVRGTGYSIIKNGQIEGMVANNVFISDEEGVYYKAQNIKEMKEWKAAQEKALITCLSSDSSSSGSSPCGSGRCSSDSESTLQPISSNPAGFRTSKANNDTPIQTSTVSKSASYHNEYVLPLPQGDFHQDPTSTTVGMVTTKTSCTSSHRNADVATSQVSSEGLDVVDSEMISIIKELQSSFINGGNVSAPASSLLSPSQKSDSFAIQRQPMMTNTVCQNSSGGTKASVHVTTGASFNRNSYPVANTPAFHSGGVFDAPHIDEGSLQQNGQHFAAKHFNGNPSYLQQDASKINGVVEDNNADLKYCESSIARLHEDSFKDFELLPLGDIESILSHESLSYSAPSDSLHPLPSNLSILEHGLMDSQSESYEQKLAAANLPATTEVFQTESALYNGHGNPSLDAVSTSDLVSFTFTIANGFESTSRMDLPRKKEHGPYIEELKENSNLADEHLHKNHNTPNSSSEPTDRTNSNSINFNPEAGKFDHSLSIQPHSAAGWVGRK